MSYALKVAVAGLGTVGGGTVQVLQQNAELLAQRAGRPIKLVAVAERNADIRENMKLGDVRWYDDAMALVDDPEIDVIVELIGGAEGIAKRLCEAALAAGKSVVTANKALLAHHGTALGSLAESKGATLGYEAAVAGGIPIIKALREGLAANSISRVYGILNGTCNYILTTMRETGRDFAEILTEAQDLGYAEADPSFDVDGIDAAHKVAIMASVAFGAKINFEAIHVEGIRHVSTLDIKFAQELGYRIKLLGIASLTEAGLEQRVHPCMVPLSAAIATVEGVFNAVVADGDFIDTTLYQGRGAGAGPTASAVVADIMDIARGRKVATFAVPADSLREYDIVPMAEHFGAYYVRLMVRDKPGVFADVATVLRNHDVSMESILQHTRNPGEAVSVVMTLHETKEASLIAALAELSDLESVIEEPRMIRIETFD